MDEKPKEVLEKVNAELLKRVYIISALICCVFHVVIIAIFLHLDAIIWSAQIIRENVFVLIFSLVSLFMMNRAKSGIIELPHKSKTFDSKSRKQAMKFLFILTMIFLFLAYLNIFWDLSQNEASNTVSSSIMSLVCVLIAVIHSPLAGDG
jgi:uncharacterized membrane protein